MEITGNPRSEAESALRTIGSYGLENWRVKAARMDLRPLLALPLVEGARSPNSSNTADQQDAVEKAIVQSIRLLPDPFDRAASGHFGWGLLPGQGTKKEERGKRAAEALGRTSSRFYFESGKHADFLNRTPADYVIGLMVCAMSGSNDPVADLPRHLAEPAPQMPTPPVTPPPPSEDPDRPKRRQARRIVLSRQALARTTLAAALTLILAWALITTNPFTPGVSPRTRRVQEIEALARQTLIIDAATGKVTKSLMPPRRKGGPVLNSTIEDENRLSMSGRACTEVFETCEPHPLTREPLQVVDAGNTLDFLIDIESGFPRPVKELRLLGAITSLRTQGSLALNGEWLTPGGFPTPPITLQTPIQWLSVPTTGALSNKSEQLEYLPGSTRLYEPAAGSRQENRLLAELPDTLFGPKGLTLTNVGGSTRCGLSRCSPPYVATILSFKLRLHPE